MTTRLLSQTAAAETAPLIEREVFVRDLAGKGRRVPLSAANALVAGGLADRVSAAGHVRLKPGIGIEKTDCHRGAAPSVTTAGRQDMKEHHPRCGQWKDAL
jgi:hypothetical protein